MIRALAFLGILLLSAAANADGLSGGGFTCKGCTLTTATLSGGTLTGTTTIPGTGNSISSTGDIKASSFQPTAQTALYGLRGNGAQDSTGIMDLMINNSSVLHMTNGSAVFGFPQGGGSSRNSSAVTLDGNENTANTMSFVNKNNSTASQAGWYIGNDTADGYASMLLNGSGNSTGNGVGSMTFNTTGALFLQTGATNAMTISTGGAVGLPRLAASSAAQTGTVCWTTGTGNLTVDTTATCLVSLEDLKDIKGPIDHALSKIMALKPFWFSWKDKTLDPAEQPGMGAHQVESVDPRLAAYGADGKLRGVRYEEMTAVLVAAMQTQQHEIYGLAILAMLLSLALGYAQWRLYRRR